MRHEESTRDQSRDRRAFICKSLYVTSVLTSEEVTMQVEGGHIEAGGEEDTNTEGR
jgi:hypothetical protein